MKKILLALIFILNHQILMLAMKINPDDLEAGALYQKDEAQARQDNDTISLYEAQNHFCLKSTKIDRVDPPESVIVDLGKGEDNFNKEQPLSPYKHYKKKIKKAASKNTKKSSQKFDTFKYLSLGVVGIGVAVIAYKLMKNYYKPTITNEIEKLFHC